MRLPVFRSEPRELEDIARTIERLGALAGVFYEEWDRPLMTVNGDHVISKVIRLCGGENVFADLPLIAPEIDVEAVLRANPEVIISSGASLDAWKTFSR
jgi:iron complex transport system substrate-binding protein